MQFDRFNGHRVESRGWAAALLVVCAVVLSGAATTLAGPASKQGEVAAVPAPLRLGSSNLPVILSNRDAQLYRETFALQEKGKWRAADKRIRQLSDKRLIGHLLAQRYLHPTAYRSKYEELRDWMAHYADHPDAKRIYKLALKRRPKSYKYPKRPVVHRSRLVAPAVAAEKPYRSTKRLSKKDRRRAAQLKRQIRRNVLRTRLTITEKLLAGSKAKRLLDRVERDQGYTKVAAAWFYYGRDKRAFELAAGAAGRSGMQVPLAHWIAGLSAWRLGRIEVAARHFENLARSEKASGWNVTSGAYWAARAHLRLRNPAQMSRWLDPAAQFPRTL